MEDNPARAFKDKKDSSMTCLLYTSDAADDGYSVDLGGRRIIKKIFFKQKTAYEISEGLVGSEMCIRDRQIIFQWVHKSLPPFTDSILIHRLSSSFLQASMVQVCSLLFLS